MIRFCLFTVILLLAERDQPASAETFELFQPLMPPRQFQVMARGGALDRAPANTKPAIQLCIADQFEWVAVTVGRTKDGEHVLAEPSPLVDPAQGGKRLADVSWAELQKLDAGSWFAKRFAGARWLSLAGCLALAKGKINVCLELVDADPESLVRDIRAAGMERQTILVANRDLLPRLREAGGGSLALMARLAPGEALDGALVDNGLVAVMVDARQVTAQMSRRLHEQGVKLAARFDADSDRPPDWEQVVAAGADYLNTAHGDELVAQVLANRLRSRSCRLACHRGASHYAPENTLPAFQKAARLHADFVEFDVRPSSDGIFYLLHDAKLDRTTDGRGAIREMSSRDLDRLDAGRWFAERFGGTRMPTLEAFLAQVPPGMELYFDAKDIPPEDLARSLAAQGLIERAVVYQVADYLRKLARIDARIRCMPPARSMGDVDKLRHDPEFKPYAVDSAWRALSKEYIDHCHAAGIRVFSDAPGGTSVKAMVQAIHWGLDLIQTDEPMCYWRAVELAGD